MQKKTHPLFATKSVPVRFYEQGALPVDVPDNTIEVTSQEYESIISNLADTVCPKVFDRIVDTYPELDYTGIYRPKWNTLKRVVDPGDEYDIEYGADWVSNIPGIDVSQLRLSGVIDLDTYPFFNNHQISGVSSKFYTMSNYHQLKGDTIFNTFDVYYIRNYKAIRLMLKSNSDLINSAFNEVSRQVKEWFIPKLNRMNTMNTLSNVGSINDFNRIIEDTLESTYNGVIAKLIDIGAELDEYGDSFDVLLNMAKEVYVDEEISVPVIPIQFYYNGKDYEYELYLDFETNENAKGTLYNGYDGPIVLPPVDKQIQFNWKNIRELIK